MQQPSESIKTSSSRSSSTQLSYNDFESVRVLGMGAYGKVELVQRKGVKYALKTISKKSLSKEGKEYQAFIERELIRKMKHPGIVEFKTCFQDKYNLYFCLEYCEGGDFTGFMHSHQHRMSHKLRVLYVAEIVSIIQYFQTIGIIHRDLKPENILLSEKGHLKIIDFGTAEITNCTVLDPKFKEQIQKQRQASQMIECKPEKWTPVKRPANTTKTGQNESSEQFECEPEEPIEEVSGSNRKRRKATFVGTCFYVPPELLEKCLCYPSADLWALGCIIYQLYYFRPPFDGGSEFQVFEKINNVDLKFPENQAITEEAIDLIKALLQKDPNQRLGCNSRQGLTMKDLQQHPFFKGINFSTLFSQQVGQLFEQQRTVSEQQKKHMQCLQNSVMKQYLSLLEQSPHILIHGLIQKRTFINYNLYYLIVFTNLKMLRVKVMEPTKIRENQIELEGDVTPAELCNPDFFKLNTKEKSYKMKSSEPAKWVLAINSRWAQIRQARDKGDAGDDDWGLVEKQRMELADNLKAVSISL